MKKLHIIFITCCLLSLPTYLFSKGTNTSGNDNLSVQSVNADVVYKGKVIDNKTSEPLIGASVKLKGESIGTITDADGNFQLNVPSSKTKVVLEITYVGYVKIEYTPQKRTGIIIRLVEDAMQLGEVQVIAYGKQSKVTLTGAISSIDTKDLLKSPSGSVANMLAGAVSGISSIQASGQPGSEDPSIYVRGQGTLNSSLSKPLILVDGVERSFFQMDPNEIESINVLKDASSTAVFGVRGANGVILVTTRRGSSDKNTISVSSSYGITQAIRNLKGVNSLTYAECYNEAQKTDNPSLSDNDLMFTPYVINMFKTKADPIMFPDVDWVKYIFKNLAWQTQHNVTITGGNDRFKYFVSLGYLHEDGMMKRYYESYDPNFKYDRVNYRSNIDINLTKSTLLQVNLGGRVGIQRAPNAYYPLWTKLIWTLPFASPGFVNGKQIMYATSKTIPIGECASGLDQYYNWGYNKNTTNELNMDFVFNQKLDFITPGLEVNVKGAYNTDYYLYENRNVTDGDSGVTPEYLGFITQPGMDISDPRFDNTIIYKTDGVFGSSEPMSYSDYTGKDRNWYAEASIRYARTFGDHEVSGLLLYNQTKTYYPSSYTDIPTAYVGYVGRVSYNYKKRYMFDFNAGYNGSENFAPGKRYGFFPAFSVGWILSEEKFMKQFKFIDFLKIRYSNGLVGNDKSPSSDRFLYLKSGWSASHYVWSRGGSYQFGLGNTYSMLPDAREGKLGNSEVTWEKARKQNLGIDMKLFNSQLNITADFFYEKRRDILSTRNTLPSLTAISLPDINLGKVNNKGFEISVGWNSHVRDINYWIKVNLSYAKNKIIYMDEVQPNYSWMAQTGRSTGLKKGYIFDRFLQKDDFDADGNLLKDANGNQITPVMSLGTPRPGDSLYKDLNGDGKIDSNDVTYFGYGQWPRFVMGILYGIKWKNWELSMQWTAAMKASRMIDDEYRDIFGSTNSKMLLKFLADKRWHEGNEKNAKYPRLTFMNKNHYLEDSSLWKIDASYLRLKVAELSYTFNQYEVFKKLGIHSVRVYMNGYNLLTLFSDLYKIDVDPEGQPNGSAAYPNAKIYNCGINITF
jgi:TonB-linked SusC/RagA family outer membrane protein